MKGSDIKDPSGGFIRWTWVQEKSPMGQCRGPEPGRQKVGAYRRVVYLVSFVVRSQDKLIDPVTLPSF